MKKSPGYLFLVKKSPGYLFLVKKSPGYLFLAKKVLDKGFFPVLGEHKSELKTITSPHKANEDKSVVKIVVARHTLFCIHTLGGVGWEPPPRGPHWDLLAIALDFTFTTHRHSIILYIASRCEAFPIINFCHTNLLTNYDTDKSKLSESLRQRGQARPTLCPACL